MIVRPPPRTTSPGRAFLSSPCLNPPNEGKSFLLSPALPLPTGFDLLISDTSGASRSLSLGRQTPLLPRLGPLGSGAPWRNMTGDRLWCGRGTSQSEQERASPRSTCGSRPTRCAVGCRERRGCVICCPLFFYSPQRPRIDQAEKLATVDDTR